MDVQRKRDEHDLRKTNQQCDAGEHIVQPQAKKITSLHILSVTACRKCLPQLTQTQHNTSHHNSPQQNGTPNYRVWTDRESRDGRSGRTQARDRR